MKAIEIIIDGKTYQTQMSVDEIKKLVEKPVRTGYERALNIESILFYWGWGPVKSPGNEGVTSKTQHR